MPARLVAVSTAAASSPFPAPEPENYQVNRESAIVPSPPPHSEAEAPAPAPEQTIPPAEPPAKPERPPRTYTVWIWQETGDCLWALAERFYGDPWQWKRIYLANQDQIEDPAIIYPKQVLRIPYADDEE